MPIDDDREPDDRTFEVLDVDECRYLLRWEAIGRLAYATDGSPTVVPVNFVVVDDAVVFRTEATLAERVLDRPVSFQVDRVDHFRRVGWSVLVRGRAELADEDADPGHQVLPWAPGNRSIYVRIVPTEITGRRLELVPGPVDTRGYL